MTDNTTTQSYRDGGATARPDPKPLVVTEVNQAGEFGWVTDDVDEIVYLKQLKADDEK